MNALGPDTKDALAREVPGTEHCREALLVGLAFFGRDARAEHFVTHRNAVARLFWLLLAHRGTAGIAASPTRRLRALARFSIALPERLRREPARPARRCDQLAELRAAFLTFGVVSAGHGYHLEFTAPDAARAARLRALLHALGFQPKSSARRGREVIYFKDFGAIVELLTRIGAHEAVLALEDVRALRETKNRIHRLVNTETANLGRAARAAAAQRNTIDEIDRTVGLARLSPPLREIATLRRRHPGESLVELGRRCNPPVGKPTVASRLSAIARFAQRLRARRQGRPPEGR